MDRPDEIGSWKAVSYLRENRPFQIIKCVHYEPVGTPGLLIVFHDRLEIWVNHVVDSERAWEVPPSKKAFHAGDAVYKPIHIVTCNKVIIQPVCNQERKGLKPRSGVSNGFRWNQKVYLLMGHRRLQQVEGKRNMPRKNKH